MSRIALAVTAALVVLLQVGVAADRAEAAFPGLNGRIAFTSIRDLVADIWVMDADGANEERLTSGADWDDSAAWSPDGRHIAYNVWGGIWVMDADGANKHQIAAGSLSYDNPAWSPDGSQIVATVSTGTTLALWVMNADGAGARHVADIPSWSTSKVEWSPTGDRIVFDAGVNGRTDVWAIDPDGSDAVNLTADLPQSSMFPSWSPKGDQIAFGHVGAIWLMDDDGSNRTKVTQRGSMPAWSPDGTQIAFSDWDEIYVVDLASGTETRLTHNSVTDKAPSWQPLPVDAGLVDAKTGEWHLLRSDRGMVSFFYGNPGDSPFVGDWDCDGVETPGLYRRSDGYAYLRNSNTQGVADVKFYFGDPGDVPLAGDFNGDGCDTLSLYRPAEQRFYIVNRLGSGDQGLGAADYWFLFGNPGDTPVVGDWDGDGDDEVGLYRESTGFFYWRNSATTGVADGEIYFGDPGDRFVAGDWGVVDGRDTPAVYRPATSTLYFRYTLTEGVADASLLWPGAGTDWIPIAGTMAK